MKIVKEMIGISNMKSNENIVIINYKEYLDEGNTNESIYFVGV